ncbi:hypothetical protein [Emticicia agri]|uniref:Uncharacterized protein n=1 Tax=Emticicia agri TaxID=2492393 RepID=A0A4Q5LYY0_9BACT|nr:hypothetical protein [Emticicia agri]RYU95028.1 hypothetical protein EWM59_14185 [Emticicia agri]
MKVKLFILLLIGIVSQTMAQTVSIEPGKSVFANSVIGTEIRSEHTKPLKITSDLHLTPIDFYNYGQLHGRITTSYSSMQIFGKNGILLFPSVDSTIGPKFNLNANGKLVLADNANAGFYRLNVLENDENVAFFGNTNVDGNTTVSLNNKAYLTSGIGNFKIAGDAAITIESNTTGSFLFRSDNKNRFVINGTTGFTGIGVSSPKYPFHVEGANDTVATFKNTTANFSQVIIHDQLTLRAGKTLSGGVLEDFGSLSSTGLFFFSSAKQQNYNVNGNYAMRIDDEGKVTVRPVYSGSEYIAAKANLDVGGTIRSNLLDFTETNLLERRHVFADKDGILRVDNSSNQYMSYNFSHVQAQDWDDELRKGSGYAWFNTTTTGATMYLPVNLPDGVKITNVRIYVLDNSASDLSFTFSRNTHTTNSFTTIATATTSGAIGSIRSINSVVANETISNLDYSYYVNVSSVGNWAGNTLQFHSLVITYQY